MGFSFFVIVFFVILIGLVLGIVIPIYKNHNKATGGITNYDSSMRQFVYKVNRSGEDIINSLKIKNDMDELTCSFDFDRSIINFSEYGSNRDYYFHIQEYSGFSIVRLEQVAFIGMQSHIPYKLNPFMASKLQAELIPFFQQEF